ncbi:MAG: PD40 domain-containing protein [Bryobacterales bacterium]|nr:PD40 domain-containing protein [Bryobacterales bacterium]
MLTRSLVSLFAAALLAGDSSTARLAKEIATKGWILFSGKTAAGDWDLFVMRPDGSHKRNLTNTPNMNEIGARLSPDGLKVLYRRVPLTVKIRHDAWGVLGTPVLANGDGTNAQVLGASGDFAWAVWSPDSKQFACLTKTGIEIRDVATKQVVRKLDRKGIFQQLSWSPDGKWFLGTANAFGESWTVVRLNAETGEANPIAKFQNCTPAWFPDSRRVVNSYRPANQENIGKSGEAVGQKPGYGWTQAWLTDADGRNRRLLLGEDGKHIYGTEISPDSNYVMFTRADTDGGLDTAVMGVMRLAGAPAVRGESVALRKLHPDAKDTVILDLGHGWEPQWTSVKSGAK